MRHPIQDNLLAASFDWLKDWKALIEQHVTSGPNKDRAMQELKTLAIKYTHLENVQEHIQKIVEQVAKEKCDLEATLESYLRADHSKHPIWQELFSENQRDEDVEELQKQDKSGINDSNFEAVNESVMCSNIFTPPIDPISKGVVRDPCRNNICGHIYEYQHIVNYIKERKTKAMCPYIGCKNQSLSMAGLVRDEELKSQIQDFLDTQEAGPSSQNEPDDEEDDD